MTTVEQAAIEAAIDHGEWLEADADETNFDAYVAGYKAGHAAAMREPLWVLREEHESEVADLRAKLAEAEGRVANSKLSEIALSLAHEFEVAVASREPKSGMQVPPSGDFISCAQLPSAVGRMKWWAREIRKAQEPVPLPETEP